MKAKVTVHFGKVRVVVPCYGHMTVSDLIKASILRYKKATGRFALAVYVDYNTDININIIASMSAQRQFAFDFYVCVDIAYGPVERNVKQCQQSSVDGCLHMTNLLFKSRDLWSRKTISRIPRDYNP
uniref:Par3_HAL_N_term domain-containing protein n=1 Tax=Loa loa TaxID=7209 RepID=A0A1I7VKB1_LOALO